MTNGTKKTTAALAGAVVLASGAYAIGSQSGDGSARAAGASTTSTTTTPARPERGPEERGPEGRGLGDLATRLGVSDSKLRAAFEAVMKDRRPPAREARLDALASALGKTPAQVKAAFDKLDTAREDAFAAALGKQVGVDAAKVSAALAKVRGDRDRRGPGAGGPGRRDEQLGALASELGVSEAKLRDALRAARPARGDRDDHGADLAKALGVTEEQLRKAEEKLRAGAQADRAARRKELAAALAKELGLDAAKVEKELGDGPFPGGRGPGGPGRPDGHGGPGRHGGGPLGGRGPR